jgi:DNA-directed RNA polymerase subunit RPC12/RpoP
MCYACGSKLDGEEAAPEPAKASGGDEEIPCPECGTMISGDAVMCYACGAKIESKPKEDIAVKKVAKKRVV